MQPKLFFVMMLAMFVLATLVAGCGAPAPAPTAVPTIGPIASIARSTIAPTPTVARPTTAPVATTAPTPTATIARPTSTPAQPTTAPTSANYNGEWEGTSAKDSPLAFTIEKNELTHLNVNYRVDSGSCQFLSGSRGETKMNPPIAAIKSKDINIQMDFGDGYSLAFTGAFTSNTDASGKLIFKGNSRSCGAFEINTQWTAKKATPPASGSSASPITAPASSSSTSSADVEKAIRAFFDAINAKEVDAALKYVDDNVLFNLSATPGLGKAQLRSYLQGQINRGVRYTVSDVQVSDDEASFSLKTGNGEVTMNNGATFDHGKIDFMLWE
ncbi:MAG: nuclear transport factor 2 family protein [Chloroflexi bacterium]|nr:nuclear transport factor 2 family protein [Chloroflexota bacterium]